MGATVALGRGGDGDASVSENWQRLRISSQNDVSLAIVAVRELAIRQTMSTSEAAALITAVSELVTNVVKYAGSGLVSLRPTRQIQRPGIEVIVEDKGPGIADIAAAMRDYVSTGGTLGLGLPGAKRLVDEFDIVSRPGQGTRIRIVKWR